MNPPLIEIRDLTVLRGGRSALNIPYLALREGSILSVIGPNGAGKSTLLLAIMRLIKPSSGEIRFRGQALPAAGLHRYRRRIGLVLQDPLLFTSTVRANVAAGLAIRGESREKTDRAVQRAMELLGISHLAERRASTLSGGEAQRVSIARAIAPRPELLLMDEPFSSLDAPSRNALIEDLERIARVEGISLIFATHDREEAIRLSDEILVLNNGRIAQRGTPHEVTRYPADEFVAGFMGTDTILTGTVTASSGGIMTVSVNGNAVEAVGEAPPGAAATLCVHPDSITLTPAPSATSARNVFSGRISKVVPLGLVRKIYLDCGFTLVASVTNRSCEELGITEGMEIAAAFKATAVHVIKITRQAD